jgi:lipoyl(octanoyl) transferase
MKAFTDNRTPDTPDEFWVVEHDPVYTQGQAGKAEHLLAPATSRWCRVIAVAR